MNRPAGRLRLSSTSHGLGRVGLCEEVFKISWVGVGSPDPRGLTRPVKSPDNKPPAGFISTLVSRQARGPAAPSISTKCQKTANLRLGKRQFDRSTVFVPPETSNEKNRENNKYAFTPSRW